MSDSFHSFEKDFTSKLNSLQLKLLQFPSQSKPQKQSSLTEGFLQITQAEKSLRQMQIQLSMISHHSKMSLSSQVRRYREDFTSTKKQFREQEIKFADQVNKQTLMGSQLTGASNQSVKLLNTNSLLAEQLQRIEGGKRMALECQGMAIEASNNLRGQRNQLEKALTNNRDIGDNLSRGNRLIKAMTRRAIANKIMLLVIALVLVGSIGFIVYLKFT